MFKNARVGDRVWSVTKGWGTVASSTQRDDGKVTNLLVNFDSGDHAIFHADGRFVSRDVNPELYWDAIDFTPPPPPERRAKREGWIVPIINTDGLIAAIHDSVTEELDIYRTYNLAVEEQRSFAKQFQLDASAFPEPVKITWYELEQ